MNHVTSRRNQAFAMTDAATISDDRARRAGARRLSPPMRARAIGGCSPALIQPAEPFLDLSGEEIRQRMFLTTDRRGKELCLRPDFTIAVSRDYLASAAAGRAAGFCYLGPVFRQGDDGPSEFLQAGVESFGRTDTAAADAEMLSLGLEADRRVRRDRARHPHGRRRPVHRAGRRPRSRAGLEAPPGEGFQPRRPARARSRRARGQARAARVPNTKACSRRWRAPIRRRRTRWSPTCSRSPASTPSAAARSARSPIASSNRPRSARRPRCRRRWRS